MQLYRYEFSSGVDPQYCGILVGLEFIFDEDEVLRLCAPFEDDLPGHPEVEDMDGTLSYFTPKGNRKFNKAIREIKKAAKKKGIEVVTIHRDYNSLADIVHEDKYQVISRE